MPKAIDCCFTKSLASLISLTLLFPALSMFFLSSKDGLDSYQFRYEYISRLLLCFASGTSDVGIVLLNLSLLFHLYFIEFLCQLQIMC